MAEEIECTLLTPTSRVYRWLRRYLSADMGDVRLCEPYGYHHAMVRIGDGTAVPTGGGITTEPLTWPNADPRWPEKCDHCDYRFDPREVRQMFYQLVYRAPDGREAHVHGADCPDTEKAWPGCMWYADYYPYRGPDGHCLVVRTPGGDWVVDAPSNNGPGWTRTGDVPRVTVTPSIDTGRYHGFLTNGKLIRC